MLSRRQVAGGLFVLPFMAGQARAGRHCVFEVNGVAIGGVDPVSYFIDARPIPGTDRYRLMWRNVIWHFASHATMTAFESDPKRYAPCYGGFCAFTMARGGVSETVPEAWAMHEGRLYLTRSQLAAEAWKRDPDGYIAKADTHWNTAACG